MAETITPKFQKLNFEGLKTLVEWAEREGWNPGPYDAEVYWQTDPDGYYGYYHNNELIGGGSLVSYAGDFGFMGFFIVKPEYRSLGIGRKLWYQRRDMLLSRLKKNAPIGMDGVLAMQAFYEKGGFRIAFRDERHERPGEAFVIHQNISDLKVDDFEKVVAYDAQCFGFSRPQFLKPWIQMPGNKMFKYVDEEGLRGYAIVRKANTGYKICPLFADNETIAEELYKACLNSVVGESLFLDIPMNNPLAVQLANKYQTTYVFECARMYYGEPPKVAMNKIYGITSFELG